MDIHSMELASGSEKELEDIRELGTRVKRMDKNFQFKTCV